MSGWVDPTSAREQEEEGNGRAERIRVYRAELGLDEEEGEGEMDSDISRNGSRWGKKEKARFHSLLGVVDGEEVQAEKEMELDSESEDGWEDGRKRLSLFDPRR